MPVFPHVSHPEGVELSHYGRGMKLGDHNRGDLLRRTMRIHTGSTNLLGDVLVA
jgi:hypothetical protein